MLEEIIKNKAEEVSRLKASASVEEMRKRSAELEPPRDFAAAIRGGEAVRIIAEVKKASPSRGVIRKDFDPLAIARAYERNGAAAISVLTDEKYFDGRLEYLALIKKKTFLPVLRKDFIIDEIQVHESRAAGADALLLIVAALDKDRLKKLLGLTTELGMSALVEVHDRGELERALEADAKIIGINNRDLRTFRTDIRTTLELAPLVPGDRIIVTESGINTREDIEKLKNAGVDAFLVGESLVREEDPGRKLKELMGVTERLA